MSIHVDTLTARLFNWKSGGPGAVVKAACLELLFLFYIYVCNTDAKIKTKQKKTPLLTFSWTKNILPFLSLTLGGGPGAVVRGLPFNIQGGGGAGILGWTKIFFSI